MIYELLSTALLACSLGAGNYKNEPKNALTTNTLSSVYGRYYFEAWGLDMGNSADDSYYLTPLGNSNGTFALDDSGDWQWFGVPSLEHPNLLIGFSTADADPSLGESYLDFKWYFDTAELRDTFSNYLATNGAVTFSTTHSYLDLKGKGNDEDGYYSVMELTLDIKQKDYCDFTLNNLNPLTYSVTKTFNNCHWSGNTDHNIPDTYTEANRSNPYTYYVVANTGYYFKTDGSGIVANGGLEIVSVDYGNYPTISHLMYTTEVMITLNLPLADCSLSLTAVTFSVQEINDLYGDGFDDAKAIYGENVQFQWIKTAFDGMTGFFNIQILPNISLGFLMFAPLVVVAIVAIVRIIKHE